MAIEGQQRQRLKHETLPSGGPPVDRETAVVLASRVLAFTPGVAWYRRRQDELLNAEVLGLFDVQRPPEKEQVLLAVVSDSTPEETALTLSTLGSAFPDRNLEVLDIARISPVKINNLALLEQARRLRAPTEALDQAFELLTNGMTARELQELINERGIDGYSSYQLIWHLVAIGQVACDVNRPLSASTQLWSLSDEVALPCL